MATRALIAYKDNSKYKTIYVHNDGNLYHTGKILYDCYNTEEMAAKLVGLGDLSYVGRKLEPTAIGHSFDNPEKDTTIAYHRDRGEEFNQASLTLEELREWAHDAYIDTVYVWIYNEWHVLENGSFTKLILLL